MKKHWFSIFGVILVGLFVFLWIWHSPSGVKITNQEIDTYLKIIDKIPFPPEVKNDTLASLRAWGKSDDGQPVYMLNLIKNYEKVRHYPGAPDFNGTPVESNLIYEKKGIPLLLKYHSYPIYLARPPQGKNIVGINPKTNDISEILIVRYPNRRAFFAFLADPEYGPILPYKLMASDLDLVPYTIDAIVPDLRLIVGGIFLVLFLTVGWIRAASREL